MSSQVLEQRRIDAADLARTQDEAIAEAGGLLISFVQDVDPIDGNGNEVRCCVGIAGRENIHLDTLVLLGEVNSAGRIIR